MSELQKNLELEMRLAAIERILTELQASVYLGSGLTVEDIEGVFRGGAEVAARQTFPRLHPAQSDLAAAAWETAILRLSDMTIAAAREISAQRRE